MIKCRILRWAFQVARMEESRSAFRILTGKPTGKRNFRNLRRRCKDNIRMDIRYEELYWFGSGYGLLESLVP